MGGKADCVDPLERKINFSVSADINKINFITLFLHCDLNWDFRLMFFQNEYMYQVLFRHTVYLQSSRDKSFFLPRLHLSEQNVTATPYGHDFPPHRFPLKYLEQIAHILSKGGLLDALRGLDGGYRLNRLPSQYRVSKILLLAAGNRNERLLNFNILSGFNKLWQAAEDCHYSILEKKTLEDVLKEQTDI